MSVALLAVKVGTSVLANVDSKTKDAVNSIISVLASALDGEDTSKIEVFASLLQQKLDSGTFTSGFYWSVNSDLASKAVGSSKAGDSVISDLSGAISKLSPAYQYLAKAAIYERFSNMNKASPLRKMGENIKKNLNKLKDKNNEADGTVDTHQSDNEWTKSKYMIMAAIALAAIVAISLGRSQK